MWNHSNISVSKYRTLFAITIKHLFYQFTVLIVNSICKVYSKVW